MTDTDQTDQAARTALLRRYFGHSGFRPGQEELIGALLRGRDVFGVMPTGAGKSVCYQLPALLLPGLTLVLSPLIALMKDQVTLLRQSGIPAACLHSGLLPAERWEILRQAAGGAYRLLYVAPERLPSDGFAAFAARTPISLVAVDEAHCVSQWGQDFRPSYLKIADFLDALPVRPPVGAFTATATAEVGEDIVRLLRLRDPLRVATGFDRPNLRFEVVRTRRKTEWLRAFLARVPDQSGIVYCATRKTVDSVYGELLEAGIPAARYHAGMEGEARRLNQEGFVLDSARVMVATNAFGMGIDKSNVSFVVHYNMPKNIESYYQEAGRAGRDGEPARCVLLFAPGDVQTAKYLINNTSENEELPDEAREAVRRMDLRRLDQMTAYCRTAGCLRAHLLRYFGEAAPDRCGNCGNCAAELVRTDITLEAQKILSGVARVERKYRTGLGLTLVTQMLRGSRAQRVLDLGLDRLPTYGLLREMKQDRLRACIDSLIEQEYLCLTEGEYPVLRLTGRASAVLFHGERVFRAERARPASPSGPAPSGIAPSGPAAVPDRGPANGELYEALRALRGRVAQDENVPAYIVFTNASLSDMAARRPRTPEEFLQVSGVGQVKAERYGGAFLEAIRRWEADQR